MNEFLLLFRNTAGDDGYSISPEEMQAAMPRWREWIENGALVSTQPLEPKGQTVKPSGVTDGPYVEIKEIVVGYLVCKVESQAQALEYARSCPILVYEGGSVEVRPLIPFPV